MPAKRRCRVCKKAEGADCVFASGRAIGNICVTCNRKRVKEWSEKKRGRPTAEHSGPVVPVASAAPESIGKDLVYWTDDGRAFTLAASLGRDRFRRLYGQVLNCPVCDRRFFRPDRDIKRDQAPCCCLRCSKIGDGNPTRRRPQINPKVSADKLFSRIIRTKGRCEICGKRENLECAHGFSRRYLGTRWDERNAFCFCHLCHRHFTVLPIEWDDWLRKRWGEELYDELRKRALAGPEEQVEETLARLRVQARRMEIKESMSA